MESLLFILLHISTLSIFILLIYLGRVKPKSQIYNVFLFNIVLMLIWSLGNLVGSYCADGNGQTSMIFVYFWNIGVCFIPLAILLTGLIYANTKINFGFKHLLLAAGPAFSYLVLITNDLHHLFFVNFSFHNEKLIYGPYFTFHSFLSYSYIIIGLFYLIRSSIKNSGFFSKQSILIVVGSFIPLVLNLFVTLRLIVVPVYTTAISFSVAIIFYALAIFRYNFLSIAPIALQTVVDRISDGFLVINDKQKVIDFNKTMATAFNGLFSIGRNREIGQIFKETCLVNDEINLINTIEKVKESGKSVSFEKHIEKKLFDKYFMIEITPIVAKNSYLGSVILFKDITQNKKDIATIEEKHAIMMEQERLASLGQLIGGIAHNLKTPIMSIAGAVEALRDLVREYEQSVEETSVTSEDHKEIAGEMNSWLDKIKPYCSYMSDIIDTVKGQAVQLNMNSGLSFTVNELMKRIELLMKYELIRYKCTLNTNININYHTELYGDVNSLVQVFDNIIMNAIHAYEGKYGTIDFTIDSKGSDILFTIKDYAKGISDQVKSKLLKEMITTKGKNGTGLGLYMSYATIKGRFGGKMWFDSMEGKGTTFFIQLPHRLSA